MDTTTNPATRAKADAWERYETIRDQLHYLCVMAVKCAVEGEGYIPHYLKRQFIELEFARDRAFEAWQAAGQ